ncbi:hypothetical protein JAAARDRAFT_139358 [Jaapia argillacea MUCL 33604]|uniref:Helitron helicase-like domain-containing protein n=1 Tax=Jaapia argillacea MUCL 33604 TaxID=933084 RepID=A0A067PDU9_9AGAM|nr:hypothetical protein JAAARDRAFT_139358 [Jaapia argillacea MUCL 33604]
MFIAKNPAVAARFFDTVMESFIQVIIRYGRGVGLLGRCDTYYGMVEALGRGTLHCHMLIWLKGNPSPDMLWEQMHEDNEYKVNILKWIESIIRCELPDMTVPLSSQECVMLSKPRVREKEDPRLQLGLMIDHSMPETFAKDFRLFMTELAIYCNWHTHSNTCWKHLKQGVDPKDDAHCCMRIDGLTRSMTEIDVNTQTIMLQRLHPWINNFNDVVLFLLRCNMDIKFIGTGAAMKALIYYVTDYITKSSLPVHAGLSVLSYAIRSNEARFVNDPSSPEATRDRSLITKTVNAIMARQELSHQQVMSYLVGGGNHYTSHKYKILKWHEFDRYFRSITDVNGIDKDPNIPSDPC